MNFFKNELWKKFHQRSFLFLILISMLVGVVFSGYLVLMDTGNLEAEITMQRAEATRLLDQHQNGQGKGGKEEALYELLLKNNLLTSRQSSNLIMKQYERFNQVSQEISDLQLQILKTDIENQDFLAPEWELRENQAVFKSLSEMEIAPNLHHDNSQVALAILLHLILGFGFLFFAFFASNNLLEERMHFTLIRSFPQIFRTRMLSKVVVNTLANLCVVIGLMVSVGLSMLVFGGIGNWRYPMAVFLTDHWQTIPFWQYVLLAMLSLLVLFVLTEFMGYVANVFCANRYASFFILVLCYALGSLSQTKSVIFLPFHTLNLVQFYRGEFSVLSGYSQGIGFSFLLSGLAILCCVIFMAVTDKKNGRFGGMK